MIVKVCGITNQEDATAAVEAGANAIGFNFYPDSPRYIEPQVAAHIETGSACRVGVFVNAPRQDIEEIGRVVRLDRAQLHGDEIPSEYPSHPPVWKAVRVGDKFSLTDYDDDSAEVLVLDGPAGELYGGAGKTFDWSLVRDSKRAIVIAGGLDASNVAQAVELARPAGVDTCSRIEIAPGKKDHQKMREFVQAARMALHK